MFDGVCRRYTHYKIPKIIMKKRENEREGELKKGKENTIYPDARPKNIVTAIHRPE
uniref:Uncharacterized protein n=1 Tax=Rhizophora mucronata TaxID=61149 RepID=A0A2P2P6P2_RHIMU